MPLNTMSRLFNTQLEGCRLTWTRGEAEFTGEVLGVNEPQAEDSRVARDANSLHHSHCRPLLTVCRAVVGPEGRAR